MPRPKKTGLDYYYKGVDEFEDYRMTELVDEYGAMGYMVYDILLSKVYKNGYYLEIPIEHLATQISRLIGNRWIRDKNEVITIIKYCGKVGLIDNNFLENGVITSKEIQMHYSCVSARRKMDKTKYWLLPIEKPEEVSATETGVIATETCENATISTQRKEKKIKENEKKSNQIKSNQSAETETADFGDDENDDEKINEAYYAATGNQLSSADRNKIYHLRSDGCSDEIMVEAIHDISNRPHNPIKSFAYFEREIRLRMSDKRGRYPPTSTTAEIEAMWDAEWQQALTKIEHKEYTYDD